MTNDVTTNGHGPNGDGQNGSTTNFTVKTGLAKMLKGGVIMDVVNAEQVLEPIIAQAQRLLTHIGKNSRRSGCLRRNGP